METVSVRMNKAELEKLSNLLKEKRSAVMRSLIEEGRKALAVELYKNKKVSLGLAAKISGISISEFIDLLKEFNVMLNLDVEDAKQALRYARKLL